MEEESILALSFLSELEKIGEYRTQQETFDKVAFKPMQGLLNVAKGMRSKAITNMGAGGSPAFQMTNYIKPGTQTSIGADEFSTFFKDNPLQTDSILGKSITDARAAGNDPLTSISVQTKDGGVKSLGQLKNEFDIAKSRGGGFDSDEWMKKTFGESGQINAGAMQQRKMVTDEAMQSADASDLARLYGSELLGGIARNPGKVGLGLGAAGLYALS